MSDTEKNEAGTQPAPGGAASPKPDQGKTTPVDQAAQEQAGEDKKDAGGYT